MQIHKEYYKVLEPEDRALGNLRARIRKNILYYYANSKNLSVLGSSDKSEYLIGYFTKFGDGAADILPIASLYKTQIRALAKFLGVPDHIISKKSSPNRWPNHIAESEIGASTNGIIITASEISFSNASSPILDLASFLGNPHKSIKEP